MKKINERRFINANELQTLCIRKDWMTCSSNEIYSKFLETYGMRNNLTKTNIYNMARDIYRYSSFDDDDYGTHDELIASIMYEIAAACHTCFEIEEE